VIDMSLLIAATLAATMSGVRGATVARPATAAAAANWPTFNGNAARTGSAAGDPSLSVSTVKNLRLRWHVALANGDAADTAPIYLSAVKVGARKIPMLFLTATSGATYGINADTGHILWRFATSGTNITTSMPVADVGTGVIYVGSIDARVHRLDAATGKEIRGRGFPVRVTAIPNTEKDASGLNIANGYLYATTSGYYGDDPPYDGHVVAIRLSDGATHVFNTLCSTQHTLPTATSCSQSDSGVWGRGGAVVDPDPSLKGQIYISSGNGDFDASAGGDNYGDSVLALSADATTMNGYFTPVDFSTLDSDDVDLGSTSLAPLAAEPKSRTPLMGVQGGKDGILRLLDRTHLGGVGGELQQVQMGNGLFSSPATWNDRGVSLVFVGLPGNVNAYRLETTNTGKSRLKQAWSRNVGQTPEGTSPIVSNGILFVATSGAIDALEARTGRPLWNSTQSSAGGTIGGIHWGSPIAVNGWVYCADQNGRLSAYALPK
jgi:outer membrane protein assembly factor BamB